MRTTAFLSLYAALSLLAVPLRADTSYVWGRPEIPLQAGDEPRVVPLQSFTISPEAEVKESPDGTGSYYAMPSADAGFPIERSYPQYWLGDPLPAPPGEVDWEAMQEVCAELESKNLCVYDSAEKALYAVAGGMIEITWKMANGEEKMTYVVSTAAAGRPKRLYWTNAPYNSPGVTFKNAFVRVFGANPVFREGTDVKDLSTLEHGVYFFNMNSSEQMLVAVQGDLSKYPALTGQIAIAYYDSGLYEKLLGIEIVEVTTPRPIECTARIGEPLRPYGGGADIDGLEGFPESVTVSDNRGNYYYQHMGQHSYSPKNGNIYPLRPTDSSGSRLVVWWKEYDAFGTAWPYECCRYTCEWGENAITFVRGSVGEDPGLPLAMESSELTVELQSYQEPEGHATVPASGSFSTQIIHEGIDHHSLLKISAIDNVWFLPVRSVAHDDPRYFTREHEPLNLGVTCRPRVGSLSGTAEGFTAAFDASLSGYLYLPASGKNYNPLLYYPPTTGSIALPDEHECPSTIIPVNLSDKPLEVWWRNTWQPEDMPSPILYPSMVQCFEATIPAPEEAPQIVLASQLGSEMESRYTQGRAMRLDSTRASLMPLSRRFFTETEGTLDLRFRAPEGTSGQLITVGNRFDIVFALALDAEGHLCTTWNSREMSELRSEVPVTDNRWHQVTVSLHENNLSVTIDGKVSAMILLPHQVKLNRVMTRTAIGTLLTGDVPAAAGAEIDAISVWEKAMDQADLVDSEMLSAQTDGLSLLITCENEIDFTPIGAESGRDLTIVDASTRAHLIARDIQMVEPGSPKLASALIHSETAPTVYVQNDPAQIGYNPNEEHALLTEAGDGSFVAWAIRDDLSVEGSPHGVLVSYTENGEAKMRWYHVLRTSKEYPIFFDTAHAGEHLNPPKPLSFLPNANNELNCWDASLVPYQDRRLQLWATCSGTASLYFWYELQPDFYQPGTSPGDLVPWLNTNLSGEPAKWTIETGWKENVPTLKVGQTLTKAINGLPEVWNMSSLAIIGSSVSNVTEQLIVYDPVVRRHGDLSNYGGTVADFVAEAGLAASDKVTYRNGVYTFNDAPPGVGERLTFDPTRALETAFGLVGELEDGIATVNLLRLNKLSTSEAEDVKAVIADIIGSSETNIYKTWAAAVDQLAEDVAYPVKDASFWTDEDKKTYEKIIYAPAENYALTAVNCAKSSKDSGIYVTLVEGDCTDDSITQDSETVALHVIKIVPELYAAPLAIREHPVNLLSQKLSILYGETFAGKEENFVFEWKSTPPASNGVVSMDFENDYTPYKPDSEKSQTTFSGLTDLIIGTKDDTLDEMVNTYFAVRYRPADGTVLKETLEDQGLTGDALWSDWSGPALAEGWVQRVLNNITPFTQQMVDLYTNEAETAVTMIQKAGGPYQGDVALNQDNLKNVGLIQLYMTLLNQAERVSINTDHASVPAVDQLLLAATRAADLYTVLGDEAYADALNPTIGFGMNFSVGDKNALGLDYGALSSSLFCFDNQVPSLLEEELALLRGRAADYQTQGLLQTAPYFNRLPWNFTRGMTGGEVAYAVNYNVSGSQSASVDVEEAAQLYPQGHGDAYGHYLSALKLYYRLLRNPNFVWGESAMGEMLLGDAVMNVDYYDENRFAEIAGALGKTATLVLDRTARKAYADTAGNTIAGYRDSNEARAFGTGEWATKTGIGLLCNWAVANSLLPEAPDAENYYQTYFDGSTKTSGFLTSAVSACNNTALSDRITIEFQVVADREQTDFSEIVKTDDGSVSTNEVNALLFAWEGDSGNWRLEVKPDLTLQLSAANKNEESRVTEIGTLPADTRTLVALDYVHSTKKLTVKMRGEDDSEWTTSEVSDQTAPTGGKLMLAAGFKGSVHEFRWWLAGRSNDELTDNRETVDPGNEMLLYYLRTFTRDPNRITLEDCVSSSEWSLLVAQWEKGGALTPDLPYEERGLMQIDRSTATALTELTRAMDEVQSVMNRLDSGTNPIGLAENSVPFDLTPIGMEDGSSSHFEQLLSRAETALQNAAHVLDNVQILGSRLRQLEEGRIAYEEALDRQEKETNAELISLLGTPYSDDIGGTGLYAQGYTGPDYYHFMYMDLEAYGLSTFSATNRTLYVDYSITDGDMKNKDFVVTPGKSVTVEYELSSDGFILKPDSWTGTRAVTGDIQQAYADALVEIAAFKEALERAKRKHDFIEKATAMMNSVLGEYQTAYQFHLGQNSAQIAYVELKTLYDTVISVIDLRLLYGSKTDGNDVEATIVGTASNVAGVQVKRALDVFGKAARKLYTDILTTFKAARLLLDQQMEAINLIAQRFERDAAAQDKLYALRSTIGSAVGDYLDAASEVEKALTRVLAAMESFSTIRAKAELLQEERELQRQQAVNTLTRLRYNDMFFRQVRNDALAKYEKAFEIAQRYTYLAAQAFEYETVGDLSDVRGAILGTRSLGALADDGTPVLQGTAGEGGLADILATLKADWAALKPRLGINNPQKEITWFSLRQELFRITPSASGDAAWREKLSNARVTDLRTDPIYRRYCQPIANGSATSADIEPALVIPFSTTIDFAKNFFGNDLAGGDSAFDPTYFATRIAGAGVYFKGYNLAGKTLSETPLVWLIPVGSDSFRKPGGMIDDIVSTKVVDQVIPVPFNVGKTDLNDPDWLPVYDGNFGGADSALRIRRHPGFRATHGTTAPNATDFSALNSTRLIGRSAWNTQWVLIIPFGSMHADRETAVETFLAEILDIQIGLRTYSHSGN